MNASRTLALAALVFALATLTACGGGDPEECQPVHVPPDGPTAILSAPPCDIVMK